MIEGIPERDWKRLRSFQPEMLNALCERINKKAEKIINSDYKNEHERFLALSIEAYRTNSSVIGLDVVL